MPTPRKPAKTVSRAIKVKASQPAPISDTFPGVKKSAGYKKPRPGANNPNARRAS